MDLKIRMPNGQNQNKRGACTCHINISIYIKLYKIKVKVQKADQWLSGDGSVGMERKLGERRGKGGRIPRRTKDICGDNGYVHYLDCSDGFITLHLSKFTKFYFMLAPLYVNYTSLMLFLKRTVFP